MHKFPPRIGYPYDLHFLHDPCGTFGQSRMGGPQTIPHSFVSFCFCFLLLSSILHPSFAMSCPRLKKKQTNSRETERERERVLEKTCKGLKMAKGWTSISMQAKLILIHCSRWIKCNNLPPFAWHLMILGHVWTWWMTMCLLSWGFWSPKIAKTVFSVFPHMIWALKKALAWDSCALCSRELDGCSFLLCHLSCSYFSSQPWKSCDFAFAKNCPDGSDFTLNPLNQFFNLKTNCVPQIEAKCFTKLTKKPIRIFCGKKINSGQNTQISLYDSPTPTLSIGMSSFPTKISKAKA